MAAANVDLLADGLTVRDLGILQNALYAELALQLLGDHVDVGLAQTADQGFGGFRVLGDGDGRVFFHQTRQTREDLVFLARLLGIHGHGDAGSRELDLGELDGLGRVAQGVAGGDGGQLGQRADVTRDDLGGSRGLLAEHEVHGAGLLGLLGIGIVQHGVAGEHAGIDFEQAQLADERVSQRLEDLRGEGLAVPADANFFFAGLRVHALDLPVRRGRQQVDDVVQQLAQTHAGQGIAAHDRNDGAVHDALAQTAHGILGRELHLFEILLHQFFVRTGGRFHDGFTGGFHFAGHEIWNRDLLQGLAFAGERLVFKHAHNAGELALFHNRNLPYLSVMVASAFSKLAFSRLMLLMTIMRGV